MAVRKLDNVVPLSRGQSESKQEALDRLFREHAEPLRGMFNASMRGSPDVDDVIQEVFSRLSTMDDLPEKFPRGKKGVRSFLFTMANNLIIDMSRAKNTRTKYVQCRLQERNSAGITVNSPESNVQAARELEVIKRSLQRMSIQWRDAFILNRFRHMSYREVAQVMDVSVKTVEKYVSKALLFIRRDLKKEEAGS